MSSRLVTAEELLRLPRGRSRYRLIRGALQTMSLRGWRHGQVALAFGSLLGAHVDLRGLGVVFAAETGFLLEQDPDTVLAADAAFVRRGRLDSISPRGYFPGPPDFAVEVRSHDDSNEKMRSQAEAWIRHGCPLVVTVDLEARDAVVHRRDREPQHLGEHDTFDAGDVVPGFTLALAELFAR